MKQKHFYFLQKEIGMSAVKYWS